MTLTIETPVILQTVNQIIINVVMLVEQYGYYAFIFSLLFFAIWFIYEFARWTLAQSH